MLTGRGFNAATRSGTLSARIFTLIMHLLLLTSGSYDRKVTGSRMRYFRFLLNSSKQKRSLFGFFDKNWHLFLLSSRSILQACSYPKYSLTCLLNIINLKIILSIYFFQQHVLNNWRGSPSSNKESSGTLFKWSWGYIKIEIICG